MDLAFLMMDEAVRRAIAQPGTVRALLEASILICAGDLEVSDPELQAIVQTFAMLGVDEDGVRKTLASVVALIQQRGWQPMLDRIQGTLESDVLRRLAVSLATTCAAADGLVDEEIKLAYGLGRSLELPHETLRELIGQPEPQDPEPEKTGWFTALFGDPPVKDALAALIDAGTLGAGRPSSFVTRTLAELGVPDPEKREAESLARLAKEGQSGVLASLVRRLKDARLRGAAYTFAFGAVTAAGGKPSIFAALASALGLAPTETRRLAVAFMGFPEGRWTGAPQLDAKSAKRALGLAVLATGQLLDAQIDWLGWLFPRIGGPDVEAKPTRKLHISMSRDAVLQTVPRVAGPIARELDPAGRRAAFVALFGVALLGTPEDHARAVELAPLTGVPSDEWSTLVERWVFSSGMHDRARLGDVLGRLLTW